MKQHRMRSSVGRSGISSALASIVFTYGVGVAAQANPAAPPTPAAPGGPAAPAPAVPVPVAPVSAVPGSAAPTDAQAPASTPGEAAQPAASPPTLPAPAVDAAAPVAAPAAPAPEADAFATDPSATVTEAELGAQSDDGAQQAVEELGDEESALSIYGFADFTYTHLLSDREVFNGVPFGYPSFYVGNLNLYLSSNLGSNWRALSEVRFTYLPDGVETTDYTTGTGVVSRTSTSYADYSDYNHPVEVGGVIIERAWVEYAAHPLFTARFGQWLTPYGIWNVDHGSPAIIGTTRPYIIGAEMFPQRQTGIELYGSYGMESTQLGYHLTVSNGRGPVDNYRDYDKNKALGWRLWGQQDTDFGTFVLGTSGYKGRYTDRFQTTVFDMSDPEEPEWAYDYPINSEYKELSLAADFKWTWGGALFQGEAIMRDVAYIEATRPAASVFDGGPQGWAPDYRNWGAYGLMGYRFDWLGVMPYFGGE